MYEWLVRTTKAEIYHIKAETIADLPIEINGEDVMLAFRMDRIEEEQK